MSQEYLNNGDMHLTNMFAAGMMPA
jgi:hypothetical protein